MFEDLLQHQAFASEFRHTNNQRGIQVCFNWARFLSERWPIELVRLYNIAELSRCFLPWYLGPAGREVQYADQCAKPISLPELPSAFASLRHDHQTGIQDYVRKFQASSGPICFAAPTYLLPGNRYLGMDGNHRLAALMLANRTFEVTLCNVRGPLEANCLLDLIHWQAGTHA